MSWHKLNCDGVSCGNPGPAGGGGVLRDSRSCLKLGYFEYFGVQTSLEAEVRAVSLGLQHLLGMNITFLWLELDTLILVHILKGEWAVPWNIQYYVNTIKRELEKYVV